MRHTIYLMFLAMVIVSCGKINEKIALDEIRTLEYTRNADSQKLISFLNHKNPQVRLRAVEALGRIQDTSRVHLLANRLADENESVRKAAAFALGQLFSPSAENHLIDAIRSESLDSVRTQIIMALGKSGTEKCFKILIDYLESYNRSYEKAAAISCGILAYRNHPPFGNSHWLEVLLNAQRSPDVKWRVAYGLYRIGSPASFKNIYNEINNSEDALVRYYLIRALNSMLTVMKNPKFQEFQNHPNIREGIQTSRSPQFFDTVAKLLTDEQWFVRAAALQLIAILGSSFFNDEVLNAAKDDHFYVRIDAIKALANFNSLATRNELNKIYQSDEEWQIRGEALLTLAELHPERAFKLIEADLAESSSPQRTSGFPRNYYLIKSLEEISTGTLREKTTQRLIQLANDSNMDLHRREKAQQTVALEALVNRNEVPLEFMLEKLNSADPAIATVVATHVSLRKSAQAVDPLIEVYQNFEAPKDIEAMTAIIVALDSIKSPRAIPFLAEQLLSPNPIIQKQARRALAHLTGNPDIEISQKSPVNLKWDFKLVDSSPQPQVQIQTTKGNITLQLFPEKAPVTVANFLTLVRQNFYDSIYFHRVVPGFVIQAGDPRGDGWGGPGYSIPCEYNDIFYHRGTVGMAHAGKDTGGSQFFITHLPQPHLNGRYTAFGKVIEGMEVVDKIMMYDQIITCKLINNSK